MITLAIIISIIAGISIVFGRICNAKMAEKMGLFQGAFMNYAAGFVVSVIISIMAKEYVSFAASTYRGIPMWAYLGGIVSIGVVVLSSYLTSRVPVFYLTLLIFIGQLVTGILIDFFRIGEVPTGKILGGMLVLIGFIYNLKVDEKQENKKEASI